MRITTANTNLIFVCFDMSSGPSEDSGIAVLRNSDNASVVISDGIGNTRLGILKLVGLQSALLGGRYLEGDSDDIKI